MNQIAIESFITKCDEMMIATESKLTKAQKDALKDSAFGLPKSRTYPLYLSTSEESSSHIMDAIGFFHFCKEEDRKELAGNIIQAIKNLKLDIKITEGSLLTKYTSVPSNMIKPKENKKEK